MNCKNIKLLHISTPLTLHGVSCPCAGLHSDLFIFHITEVRNTDVVCSIELNQDFAHSIRRHFILPFGTGLHVSPGIYLLNTCIGRSPTFAFRVSASG